jgi:hypothetical protein
VQSGAGLNTPDLVQITIRDRGRQRPVRKRHHQKQIIPDPSDIVGTHHVLG